MQTPSDGSPSSTDEVQQAVEQVELHKAALARSLRQAERTGVRWAQRMGKQVKPALVVVGAVVGVAVLAGVVATVRRRSRRVRPVWLAPEPSPSALAVLARSAGWWLARLAVQRAAREVAVRLTASQGGNLPR